MKHCSLIYPLACHNSIHKVTVPATFIVLWPDLSPKLGKELPSFSDFVAIIFCGVGGGGEEEYIAANSFAPFLSEPLVVGYKKKVPAAGGTVR